MAGYCKWHDCALKDVTEYQQEQCEEDGLDCSDCEMLEHRKEEQEDKDVKGKE